MRGEEVTRDEVVRLAREAGAALDVLAMGRHDNTVFTTAELERFAALVAAAEREACAKVCEAVNKCRCESGNNSGFNAIADCADAIRARTATPC